MDNFIELARDLALQGRAPVFILGPQEDGWRAEIQAAVPGALFPLQAAQGGDHGYAPALTIALAQRLAAAVSNDSGTGHMLAAGGVRLISLFGRTVAEKFTPMAADLTIIRAQDFGGREMRFIPVGAVSAALDLGSSGRGR